MMKYELLYDIPYNQMIKLDINWIMKYVQRPKLIFALKLDIKRNSSFYFSSVGAGQLTKKDQIEIQLT